MGQGWSASDAVRAATAHVPDSFILHHAAATAQTAWEAARTACARIENRVRGVDADRGPRAEQAEVEAETVLDDAWSNSSKTKTSVDGFDPDGSDPDSSSEFEMGFGVDADSETSDSCESFRTSSDGGSADGGDDACSIDWGASSPTPSPLLMPLPLPLLPQKRPAPPCDDETTITLPAPRTRRRCSDDDDDF
jgi:hypothetical protein